MTLLPVSRCALASMALLVVMPVTVATQTPAERGLLQRLQVRPTNVGVLLDLAGVYAGQNRPDDLLEMLTRAQHAIESQANESAGVGADESQAVNLALLGSEANLRSRLTIQPGEVTVLLTLARHYYGQRLYTETQDTLSQVDRSVRGIPTAAEQKGGIAVDDYRPFTLPILVRDPGPVPYPAGARHLHIYGDVVIQAVVSEDGKVGEPRVIKSLNTEYNFDFFAVRFVEGWEFYPATVNGQKVPITVTLTVMYCCPGQKGGAR